MKSNVNDLRQKSREELDSVLADLEREQFNLRMQRGTGQLSRPHIMKHVRREVARLKTILTEMSLKNERSN